MSFILSPPLADLVSTLLRMSCCTVKTLLQLRPIMAPAILALQFAQV